MKHAQYILSDSDKLLANIHMLPYFFTCCIMVKAVALFPTINLYTYLYVTNTTIPCRGVMSGFKGGAIPRAPNDCGGAENPQQCHKHFLQYSKFPSIRPQMQLWGRQICFLPRAPSNLVTPLVSCRSTPESRTALQGGNEEGKGHNYPGGESVWGRRIAVGGVQNPNSITSAFFK